MSFNWKDSRSARVASATLVLAVFALAGCGTDDDTFVKQDPKVTTETVERSTPDTPAPSEVVTKETVTPLVTPQEVTYEVAERAFLDAHYGDAVDLFTRYTQRKPDNSFGHYMLGLSAWKDGRLDLAEAEFNRSLTLDPAHLKSCLNLSRVLIEVHRPSEALATLDRALAIDSTSSAAYRLKGNALADLGRGEEAVAAYRNAIQIDPTDAWSMNNLAFIRIQQGRYDDALPALARATQLRKDVPVFYNNLGMALEHCGHYAAAADAYGFAISLDGSNTKAAQNRDRTVTVRDDPALPEIDLAALAHDFESSILEGNPVASTPAPADSVLANQPRP